MPVQVEINPRKPRNNVAGIKASPMRKGIPKPAMSKPPETIMQGRGSRLFTNFLPSTAKSLASELVR